MPHFRELGPESLKRIDRSDHRIIVVEASVWPMTCVAGVPTSYEALWAGGLGPKHSLVHCL
ncbi:hypothetical protein Taro_039892 [Colocasia esculenta]|uniref:Uncharacterized protein n=1 Tax=Colocasia esculenta TaxID=4460 RepID=A0A843WK75_COLES|nr:hypothetical protein [Colocasia esculenta]